MTTDTNLLTTKQVADMLNVTTGRIRAFIYSGRLRATKKGQTYLISRAHLKSLMIRKVGRPKKEDL
jgi:excisionase family DNA binding protein